MAIVKRGKVWQVQVRVGKDPRTGKWVRKAATCYSEAEARRVERRLLAEAEELRRWWVEPTKETLFAYTERWLEERKRALRPGTWERYDTLLRRHVLPVLGKTALPEIAPAAVERMLSDLATGHGAAGEVLSPRTVAFVRAVLRALLQDARRLGLVATNVVERTRAPKQAPKQVTAFTLEQVDALLSAAEGTRAAPLLRFLAFSGLRRGEALGLRWEDVNMDAGTVAVRRSRVPSKDGTAENAPKTEAGVRCVTLPSPAVDALRVQWAQQEKDRVADGPAYRGEGYVFATADGAPLLPKNVTRDFYRVREEANRIACMAARKDPQTERIIPALPLHALRHTAVSVQIAAGVPLPTISKRIGHKQYGLTVNQYGHLLPEADTAAAQAVDALLARRNAIRKPK
jgi:integrase